MHALKPRVDQPFRPAAAYEVLNNTTRKSLLSHLRTHGSTESIALADLLGISNLKLYNHLSILEDAGLIRVRTIGTERHVKFRPVAWARLKNNWQQGMTGRAV